jgi:hypothetical protein
MPNLLCHFLEIEHDVSSGFIEYGSIQCEKHALFVALQPDVAEY